MFCQNSSFTQCFQFLVCRTFWKPCRTLRVRRCDSWAPLLYVCVYIIVIAAPPPTCVMYRDWNIPRPLQQAWGNLIKDNFHYSSSTLLSFHYSEFIMRAILTMSSIVRVDWLGQGGLCGSECKPTPQLKQGNIIIRRQDKAWRNLSVSVNRPSHQAQW